MELDFNENIYEMISFAIFALDNQESVQSFYDLPQQEPSHKNYHKTKQTDFFF